MGTFSAEITLRNWQNRFLPPDARGEDVTCEALVDTGAIELALPAEIIERLRLEPVRTVPGQTADGTLHDLRVMAVIEVELQGRTALVDAVELPRGARPLLGAVPLELMDWHVDPRGGRLVPNPASPDRPLWPLL